MNLRMGIDVGGDIHGSSPVLIPTPINLLVTKAPSTPGPTN